MPGLKLPGTLNAAGTELAHSCKEKIPTRVDNTGHSFKLQREWHTLRRAVMAEARGRQYPVLLELIADRSQLGHRRGPKCLAFLRAGARAQASVDVHLVPPSLD